MNDQLTREQLVELVQQIIDVQGTEEQIDHWIQVLQHNVPDPEVTNLIFYTDEPLTAEEIIDRALSYKPITMPPRLDQ